MLKLGLRTKFFLYSNTLIVVTMTLVTVLSVVHERRERYGAIDRRARSIAEAMAIPITSALRSGEDELIDATIGEIEARNQDLIRFVLVADPEGRIRYANRDLVPEERYERALDAYERGRAPISEILEGGGPEKTLEVRTPLADGLAFRGSLALGISLEPIEEEVRRIAKRAAVVALILMIGNSAMTAIYVETLIRPILGLNQTMKWAGRGDLSVRARVRRGDEVGELADRFNRMMDELEQTHERDRHRLAHLSHTEKMAAVGTLAAGVAHEVNNPLGGILACIENMRSDPDNEEMRERYLELIHDGLKRIERTVANLLDFSRERQMRLEPTSINHNLRHVVELVGYQARKRGVQVAFELDPAEPMVMADHFQMEQMFLNLTLNALQAMPKGGILTLHTRHRDGNVVAEVRDTGIGVSEEIRERIFDPFFTTREVGEGTGLGLAVTDSIIVAHGGTIEVESVEGRGSTFRIRLAVVDLDDANRGGA